jgi:hypothetical protein
VRNPSENRCGRPPREQLDCVGPIKGKNSKFGAFPPGPNFKHWPAKGFKMGLKIAAFVINIRTGMGR